MKTFAKERPLTPSWDLIGPNLHILKENVWQVLYLSFLPSAFLSVGLELLNDFGKHPLNTSETIGIIATAVGIIWAMVTYPGFLYFTIQAGQGKEISTAEALRYGLRKFFPLVGLGILAGLATMIGFIFFIIPGLIILRALYLASYYLIENKLGVIDAMKKSYTESQPVSGWIWGTIGVALTISLFSGFLSLIPVLGPILSLVVTYLYIFGPALRYIEVTGRKIVSVPESSGAVED